jgi:hypothetical protein
MGMYMTGKLRWGCFGILFLLWFGIASADPVTATEAQFLSHPSRAHHTVLKLDSGTKKLAIPRAISTSLPFNLITRLAVPEALDLRELYQEKLMAKVTLWGPGFPKPMTLEALAPAPFPLPSFALSGTYHLTDLRLYLGETSIAYGLDDVTIDVFEKLLVTEVTTRPLTLGEIVDRGIVIDQSSFSSMDFTAALAYSSQNVRIDMQSIVGPPTRLLIDDEKLPPALLPENAPPDIVFKIPDPPDPQIPNLYIAPLDFKRVIDKDEVPPPPPPLSGFVVIPGQIAFLHQFFEAQLVVLQNAPQGTPLIVRNLTAKIVLPEGNDQTSGTDDVPGDDPLRIARQKDKTTTRALPILKLNGTQNALSAQERGNANFLIEGLAEGVHDISFEITGILEGLPGGPVQVAATANGSVLVRNPTFTMTLSHPATIRAGEDYNLYAIVTNTGAAPSNLVSVRLDKNAVSGAILLSAETQTADTIAPGSSATLTFRLRSRITGKVTATTFPTGDGLIGRFGLRTGVGDLGIPLSPDTLILPNYVSSLPASVVEPAMSLLGLAYSIATAPAGALPSGMTRIPKKIVEAKALALAQAGLHLILGMSLEEVLGELLEDMTSGPDSYLQLVSASRPGKLLVETLLSAAAKEPSLNRTPRILAATQPAPGIINYPKGSSGCIMRQLHQAGVYLFALANEPLDTKSAQTVSNYSVEGVFPVAAMLDPTGRFIILQLARPVGPFIERVLKIHAGLLTRKGQPVETGTLPIRSYLSKEGAGVVSGRLVRAGGTVAEGSVIMTISNPCEEDNVLLPPPPPILLIGDVNTVADSSYQFDYVLSDSLVRGQDIASGEYESVHPSIRFAGQTILLDLILRALGAIEVTLLDDTGKPAPLAEVLVTSATSFVTGQKVSLASALRKTDEQGKVRFSDLPVGPYQLQARLGQSVAAGSTAITKPRDIVSVTLVMARRPELLLGAIRARVLAPDGKTPVEGAWLRLSYLLRPYQRGGQTDAEGYLAIDNFLAGDATLEMYDPVSLETATIPISILPNQTVSATIIQKGLGSVKGRVIDSVGAPVSGVLVVAKADNSKGTQWGFTDTQGKFAFASFPMGSINLSATEPVRGRNATASTKIRYGGDVAQVEMMLSSRASIIGTVKNQQGQSVANAEVRINIPPEGGCPPPPIDQFTAAGGELGDAITTGSDQAGAIDRFEEAFKALIEAKLECIDAGAGAENILSFTYAKTDSLGNYRFSNLDLTLSPFRSGHIFVAVGKDAAKANFALTRDGEVKRVDLAFVDRTGAISGQVLDRASHDLPVGARVVLYGVEPNAAGLLTENRVISWADTDPQTGQFSFSKLYPGPFRLTASNPFHPDEVSVTDLLAPGELKKINLIFEKQLSSITGRVIGPNRKTPQAGVRVRTMLASVPIEVTTDAHGIYKIGKVLPAGYYQVEVDDPATGARSEPVTVNLDAGQEGEVPLQVLGRGAIEVHVLSGDGQAVKQASVKVTRIGNPIDRAEGESDAKGIALFNQLLEGAYAVEVADPLGRGAREQVVIPADRQTGWVSVVLSEVGSVSGTFLAVDKTTPVSPARLLLLVNDKEIGFTTTEADGAFLFEHVPIGLARVLGFNPATSRRAEGAGPLSRNGQDLPLLLIEEGLGTVSGKVLAADKVTGVSGLKLLLTSRSALGVIYGISRPDGSFSFEGIPVGPVSLTVEDRQTEEVSSGMGIIEKEGDELVLTLIQAGSGSIDGTVIFADGQPVPYANVVSNGIHVQTDADGHFSLPRLSLASHTISVDEQNTPRSGVGYVTLTQQGERLSVTIKLSGLGTMTVHITDGGAALAGAKVVVQPADVTFISDANGEAHFMRLPQGSYTITATSPDQRRTAIVSAQLVLDQEQVVTRIEMGVVGSILARVNRGGGTTPARGIRPAEGAVATLVGAKVTLNGTVKEDGMLSFDHVPLGSYTLTLDEAGTGSGTVQGLARVLLNVQDRDEVNLGTIVLDSEPIRILSVSPFDGEQDVALDQPILVRFSEPLNISSLSPSTFQVNLHDATGTHPIDGLVSFDASGTELTFTPKPLFKSSTLYQMEIAKITDRVGHEMAGSIAVAFLSADRILPKIVSIDPADGKVEVEQHTVIRIVFSEPIAAPKIENVRLTRIGSADVLPLQISLANENRLLIAQPGFPLQINQVYAVLVDGITDLFGNLMKKAARVQFATQDTIPPVMNSFTRDPATPPISGQPFRVMASALDSDLSTIEIALDQSVVGNAYGTGANRELTFTFPFSISDQPILTAVAIDQVGNRSPASRIVLAPQDGPPVIVIEGKDTAAPGETIHLILRSEDSFGLGSVSYTTRGELVQSDSRLVDGRQDQWAVDFTIPPTAVIGGLFTVSATAVDNGGLLAVATKVFRLRDNKPPMVEIITPPELFFGRTGEIKIHALDANSTIASVAIEIGGAVQFGGNFSLPSDRRDETVTLPLDIPLLQTGGTSLPGVLPPGEGRIVVVTAQATDKAGNRGEASSVSINLVGGAVTGTIFNGTNPVPRVTVWADTGTAKEAVTTNLKGQFLLTGLLPGKVNIIAADTGRGMMATEEATVLDHGTIAHLDLFLQPGGSILGQVKTATGKSAGRGVTVKAYTAEGRSFQTLTDNAGVFKFNPLPLTQVYLNAEDADGNQTEQASILLFEANQKATLQFIPRGTVFGQVVFGDSTTPAAYAQITLYGARSVARNMTADQDGKFSFDRVFAGQFSMTAVDPVLWISETVSGALPESDGAKKEVIVTLTAMGTVKGTVYSADKKPAVGNMVVLSGAIYRATQTDGEGRFEFKQVPAGKYYYTYSLSASDPASGDYTERKQVTLLWHGDEVVQDLTLAGFGEVDIYVKSASGAPIAGAKVTLWGDSGNKEQVSDLDGLAQFRSVLAGQYHAQATVPPYGVYTFQAHFAIRAGERSLAILTFPKMGTIAGRVLAPDKVTPVPGVTVSTDNAYGRTGITDSQGHFSLPFLDVASTFHLQANVQGRVRAMLGPFSLSRDGEVKEVEMVLMPVGTVTGKVFDSFDAPMQSAYIQLSFVNPLTQSGQQETMYVYSGQDGSYQADQVPVGLVLIKASSYYSPELKAEAKGVLRYDNEVLVVNVYLGNNKVELPASLQTATVIYQITKDGSYNIHEQMSRQVRNCACNQLTLTVNGQVSPFPEGRLGEYGQDKQGIGMTREGPGGIVVTRKLFAPKRGVAVRALELFTNPTDDPIDLKLEISSQYTSIFSTQNGTTTVQSVPGSIIVAGRATTTDTLASSYYLGGQPVYRWDKAGDEAVGTLFGGAIRTGQPFQQNSVPVKNNTYWGYNAWETRTTYGMDEVHIEPGATVGFLHFDFLPWNEASGEAILNRLRGLPPEMLEGISQEEQDAIINFDLKKDRDLQLTKPVMLSKLSVQAFQKLGSELVPIPNARIDFQSADPLFPLTHTAMTNAEGSLTLDYQKTEWWDIPSPLPTGLFQIQAFAHIGMSELIASGTIAVEPMTVIDQNGELSATLVFTETGAAEISFERPGGITGNAHLTLTNKETGAQYPVAGIRSPTSAVTVLALPPGHYQATLTLDHPQIREGIVGSSAFDLFASTKTDVAIRVETGHLEGTVTTASGQPAKGVGIELGRPCVYGNKRWCSSGYIVTDQNGAYQFIHLPLGLVRLVTQDSNAWQEITEVNVHEGKTIRNLVLGAIGDLRVQVLLKNGLPAIGSKVELGQIESSGDYWGYYSSKEVVKYTGITDETGVATFSFIPARRDYIARAFRPEEAASRLFTEQSVLPGEHKETVKTVLTLPAVGTVVIKVERAGGEAVPNQEVVLPLENQDALALWGGPRGYSYQGYYYQQSRLSPKTNSQGLTEPLLWIGSIGASTSIQTFHGAITVRQDDSAPAEGERKIVALKLPILANFEVKTTNCGEPFNQSLNVYLTRVNFPNETPMHKAIDKEGIALFKNVAEGEYLLRGISSYSMDQTVFSVPVSVSANNDHQTIQVDAPFCRLTEIAGQVVLADHKTGIPGAKINLTDITGTRSIMGNSNWSTDADGRFKAVLAGYVGEVKITATVSVLGSDKPIFQTVTAVIHEGRNSITLPPFVFPMTMIEVMAKNCGESVAGRIISLETDSPDVRSGYEVTDATGKAVFRNVPDGQYRVSVFSIKDQPWQRSWQVFSASTTVAIGANNQMVQIDAAFCRLPTKIKGQVFAADGKTELSNAKIELTYSLGVGPSTEASTDEAGRFEVMSLNEYIGDVEITATPFNNGYTNYSKSTAQMITVDEAGGQIQLPPFVLPLSVVKGRISQMYRGRLDAPTHPTLFATYNEDDGVRTVQHYFYKGGRYLFLGLRLGDFEITAQQYGAGQTEVRKGRIEMIDQAVEIDILLPPVNDVRVLVKNADGTGLKTGRIGIDQVGSSFTILRDLEQGKDGEIILKEIPAGVPFVIAADNGDTISRPEFIVLPETDQLITVTLSFPKRTASVTGQAVAADGFTPLTESAYVLWRFTLPTEAILPTPFGFFGSGEGYVQISADGSFHIDSLPSASIQLKIYDSVSERFGEQTLTLKEEEVRSITLIANKENTDTGANPVLARLLDCESLHECLFYQTSLMIGKRDVSTNIDTNYQTEGETVVLPPISVGSLAVSRRFVNMPGSDRGVLSIDQIKNPYPVSIATTVERNKEDSYWFEVDRYHHPTGGAILSLLNQQARAFLHIFASSADLRGQRIVVPAMSCRSIINLWDILPLDSNSMQGENFSKGVDLLNRFATLDLKSIVSEGDLCPLAE